MTETRTMTLAEAVRPNRNRDDLGSTGEALCQLCEAFERRLQGEDMPMVTWPMSPEDLWKKVDLAVSSLEAETSFRQVHAVALRCLEDYAAKAAA